MPSEGLPTVLHFRVDETTFAEFARIIRQGGLELGVNFRVVDMTRQL